MTRHRWKWKDVCRRFRDRTTGRWRAFSADGIELFALNTVAVTRYRYRPTIPTPWEVAAHV